MKAFTLIEVIIYSVLIVIVLGAIADFAYSFYKTNDYLLDQRQAVLEAREAFTVMVHDIREARYSQSGAYPVKEATSQQFRFFKDADDDGIIEEVRFWLNGTALIKEVREPDNSLSQTITLSSSLRNDAQGEPLFRYYDASNQLVADSSVLTDIRVVGITFIVNVDPIAPPSELLMNVWVKLRNIK